MLKVTPAYTTDPSFMDCLKEGAERHLRHIPSRSRMELVARGLGLRTGAALLVAPLARRLTTIPVALEFARARGWTFEPIDFHRALAQAAIFRAARLLPALHWSGMGSGNFRMQDHEFMRLSRELGRDAASRQRYMVRSEKFEAHREQFLTGENQADQTLRAIALLAAVSPRKTLATINPSSYRLKHYAEELTFDLGDGVILKPGYVGNGHAIVAAIEADFRVRLGDQDNPNAGIAITKASLRPVEDAYNRVRRQS